MKAVSDQTHPVDPFWRILLHPDQTFAPYCAVLEECPTEDVHADHCDARDKSISVSAHIHQGWPVCPQPRSARAVTCSFLPKAPSRSTAAPSACAGATPPSPRCPSRCSPADLLPRRGEPVVRHTMWRERIRVLVHDGVDVGRPWERERERGGEERHGGVRGGGGSAADRGV